MNCAENLRKNSEERQKRKTQESIKINGEVRQQNKESNETQVHSVKRSSSNTFECTQSLSSTLACTSEKTLSFQLERLVKERSYSRLQCVTMRLEPYICAEEHQNHAGIDDLL